MLSWYLAKYESGYLQSSSQLLSGFDPFDAQVFKEI